MISAHYILVLQHDDIRGDSRHLIRCLVSANHGGRHKAHGQNRKRLRDQKLGIKGKLTVVQVPEFHNRLV